MKAVLLCGSRNPEGQTSHAADAVVRGLTRGGFSVEKFFLPHMNIERCRQCDDDGWGLCREKGSCAIDDDLRRLVSSIEAADAVVCATPVYYSDLSESLRAFLDRLRRIYIGFEFLKKKPFIGVCVAGGSGGGTVDCCSILHRVAESCGFDVVDMFPVRRQNLQTKIREMELAGEEFAISGNSDI